MPRNLPIGNGSLLVAFDGQYRLADFYYPRVGMENHAAGRFRFGVWADDALHATDEPPWQRTLEYLRDTLVTDVQLQNDAIELRIRCYDTVDPDCVGYLRKIVVRKASARKRVTSSVSTTTSRCTETGSATTVMFDRLGRDSAVQGERRCILVNQRRRRSRVRCEAHAAAGEGRGPMPPTELCSMTAIAQGAVDATIAIPLHSRGTAADRVLLDLRGPHGCGSTGLDEVSGRGGGPSARAQWIAWYTWVNKPGMDLADLPDEIIDFYRRCYWWWPRKRPQRCGARGGTNPTSCGAITIILVYVDARRRIVCAAMDRAGFLN